jgi:DNA-binding MarR family transcriptional regulator
MNENYYNSIVMVERLHRMFLESLKIKINKLRIMDINNVQSLLLYNIGEKKMSVGDLTAHGCYLGSNVTYNLRKLVENGYVFQCRHEHDRRSSEVSLTDKGLEMYEMITHFIETDAKGLQEYDINDDMIKNMIQTLAGIEKYIKKTVSY